MKKLLLVLALFIGHLQMFASEGNDNQVKYVYEGSSSGSWSSNYFIGVQGGVSSFVGNPLGCGDMIDRMTPSLQLYVGKWVTPTVGLRLMGQGMNLSAFRFKDCELKKQRYSSYHVDFLYNLSNTGNRGGDLSRLDFVPYLGLGMMHNPDYSGCCDCPEGKSDNYPFSFAYGIQLNYRMSERLKIGAELGGVSTFANFDGKGEKGRLGDNIFSLNVGISYSIGKTGWGRKSHVDDYSYYRKNDVERMDRVSKTDDIPNQRNGYTGLNSLLARLQVGLKQSEMEIESSTETEFSEERKSSSSDSLVGVPIYFFFKQNTTRLVDKSQVIQLDEIAALLSKGNYTIQITGAADKHTGTARRNKQLSVLRAKAIASELKKRGVSKSVMTAYSAGGISTFKPIAANRHTMVVISKNE